MLKPGSHPKLAEEQKVATSGHGFNIERPSPLNGPWVQQFEKRVNLFFTALWNFGVVSPPKAAIAVIRALCGAIGSSGAVLPGA